MKTSLIARRLVSARGLFLCAALLGMGVLAFRGAEALCARCIPASCLSVPAPAVPDASLGSLMAAAP